MTLRESPTGILNSNFESKPTKMYSISLFDPLFINKNWLLMDCPSLGLTNCSSAKQLTVIKRTKLQFNQDWPTI